MIKYFYHSKKLVLSGSSRSKTVKVNIIGSFIIKGLSLLTSLTLVPLTLNILDSEKYGIWITIFTLVNWFNIMDIGLGNGFRNKFAEVVALNNELKAKKYISTLYTSTVIVSLSFLIIYTLLHSFLNWENILNIPTGFDENISRIVFIIIGLFSLQFVFKNITTILLSLQKTAFSNIIIFVGQLLSFCTILLLSKLGYANLMTISIAFMMSPILVNGICTYFLFRTKLKKYLPNKILVDKYSFNNMMNLGIKFFFIQITTIVMFSAGNIIIAQLYGPKQVTPYNIVNQFYQSGINIFSIITAPFWSAYTEAITKRDFSWIKNSINKLNKIWLLFALAVIIILLFSPLIFNIWIGQKVQIPFILSFSFALYVIILSWTSIYAQFLNGSGKIKIQLYISFLQCVTNIPLAVFLSKVLDWGIVGVIMATNINLILSAIILPIQTRKIFNQKAYGIWNK
ncbi:MAG: MATE family efflux transporter [Porphyromonadaceae bacterium]|nr:MATE family efflux transporter [Porphyromonadaceae bacterium]